MNRRAFLQHTGGATALLLTQPLFGAAATNAGPTDDEILAEAKTRIAKHRQGDAVVTMRGADGKPIPGVTVKVKQLRHDFLFGCNAFMVGRIKDPARETEYRRRFAALLNYATLAFYWGAYESQRGQPNYDYTDRVLTWCRAQGITVKGHPLAWDHPASSPKWLTDDLAEVQRLSTARVREIITRFKGRIDFWDVVNEPTDLTRFKNPMNTWAQELGAVPFTRLHLDMARQANPQATLLVNDYRVDPAFHKILEALRADGKPRFDAIGIQSHMHGGGWRLSKVWEVCDRFADFGVPLHFTETTIVSGPRLGPGENWGASAPELESKQADYVANFYITLFAHPAAQALAWWDFADLGAWQGAAAGWLRKDMSPKPVYDRLMALIKGQWWTRTEGLTNENGEFNTRLFFGTHRLTATFPDGHTVTREVHCQRGAANRFEVKAN
jgi:GH35 family endo-1,4-beta-xylanase